MEDAISKLRIERAALTARLNKIDAAIAEYERWAASVVELVGAPTAQTAVDSPKASPHQSAVNSRDEAVVASSIQEFEDAVLLILEKAHSPYQRSQMLSALEHIGIVVTGADKANTMASRLYRMDSVVNLKGFGYWLKSRPYPLAGHTGAEALTDDAATDDKPSISEGNLWE